MHETMNAVASVAITLLFIWWTALIVLSIKGLLFHRQERPLLPDISELPPHEAEMLETLRNPPSMPLDCNWMILFFFWPMAIGYYADAWLARRKSTAKKTEGPQAPPP